MSDLWNIGRPLPPLDPSTFPGGNRPDWVQSDLRYIDRALERSQTRENGGWVVLDASRRITEKPRKFDIDGQEWVAWRVDGELRVASNDCPHMGAPMCEGRVDKGDLICPWHALRLGTKDHGTWKRMPVFEDGVLSWARLLTDEALTDKPIVPARPPQYLDGVVQMAAKCEPQDVVANRLDPWHGVHFHGHSFATLVVTNMTDDCLTVRVAYRVIGNMVVEVDCEFRAITRRCIVMTIVGGDGIGSVVESHASPIGRGQAMLTEATLAWSDRIGFPYMYAIRDWVRPMIEKRATRLWIEDVAYAERRCAQRNRLLAAK